MLEKNKKKTDKVDNFTENNTCTDVKKAAKIEKFDHH